MLGYKGWGTLCSGLYRLRDSILDIRVVAHFEWIQVGVLYIGL